MPIPGDVAVDYAVDQRGATDVPVEYAAASAHNNSTGRVTDYLAIGQ